MSTTPRPSRAAATLLMAAALVGAFVVTAPSASAKGDTRQRKAQVDRMLRTAGHDLDESSRAVQAAAAALSRVRARLPAARHRASVAHTRLLVAQARADAAKHALQVAHHEQQRARSELQVARERVDSALEHLGDLARAVYETGPLADVSLLIDSRSPAELVSRTGYVQQIFRAHNRQVADLAAARALYTVRFDRERARTRQVAAATRAAATALAHVRSDATAADAAKRAVQRLLAQRQAALAGARTAHAADLREYRALRQASARLAARLRAEAAAARARAWHAHIGRMLWPADGPLTSSFGWRMHPIFHEMRFHAGIDIGAGYGAPVRAAASGRVIAAGPVTGYGTLVLIEHGVMGGHDIVTGYAHLSAIRVSVGQYVSAGRTVGAVGNAGYSTGPHLHFEVRADGTPVDPMRFL